MPPAMFNTRRLVRMKRLFYKMNFGGHESNPETDIKGNENRVYYNTMPETEEQKTLLRKSGDQAAKILEGGTSLIIAPAKWLAHMQENWLTYLVFGTILIVCILIIYCIIRRKIASIGWASSTTPNISQMITDEAIKLATFRRALQDG